MNNTGTLGRYLTQVMKKHKLKMGDVVRIRQRVKDYGGQEGVVEKLGEQFGYEVAFIKFSAGEIKAFVEAECQKIH